jgi:hypothetical protein
MEMRIAAWMYFGGWSHDVWSVDMVCTFLDNENGQMKSLSRRDGFYLP